MLLLGGQRRQILASFRADRLHEATVQGRKVYALKLPTEKAPRTNCPDLPLSARLEPLIHEFEAHVRPRLFKDPSKADSVKALWINSKGCPMEGKTLTREVKACTKAFNSSLAVTPVQFRRMTVTRFFRQGPAYPPAAERQRKGGTETEEEAEEEEELEESEDSEEGAEEQDPLLLPECSSDFVDGYGAFSPQAQVQQPNSLAKDRERASGSITTLEKLLNVKQGVMAAHYDRGNTFLDAASLLEQLNRHLN